MRIVMSQKLPRWRNVWVPKALSTRGSLRIQDMETVFVKIIAAALAFSQVAVTPDAVKTEFRRDKDERQVVELLRAGCRHMIEAFAIENISIDELIETAMNDPQAAGGQTKEFRGLNFGDLHTAYRQFCKHQEPERPVV